LARSARWRCRLLVPRLRAAAAWAAAAGRYDAAATPSTGQDTLFDHRERLVRGEAVAERGGHAVL